MFLISKVRAVRWALPAICRRRNARDKRTNWPRNLKLQRYYYSRRGESWTSELSAGILVVSKNNWDDVDPLSVTTTSERQEVVGFELLQPPNGLAS